LAHVAILSSLRAANVHSAGLATAVTSGNYRSPPAIVAARGGAEKEQQQRNPTDHRLPVYLYA
jgi:hypothetical protein